MKILRPPTNLLTNTLDRAKQISTAIILVSIEMGKYLNSKKRWLVNFDVFLLGRRCFSHFIEPF